MKKASEITISNVTDEQIGRCHKCFDDNNKAFYVVESERDSLTEYRVRWSKERGFTCSCKAGEVGFSNCRDGVCKHVKWSLAAAKEERDYFASLEQASKPAAALPALTPVSEWTAAERRDYRLNESRNNALDELARSLEMARNPAARYQ
jgi:hypothetical protein